jgi:gamma-glutamylcyclotransferase (GGCT)/AIG2-like uncharacterized protein YtfP
MSSVLSDCGAATEDSMIAPFGWVGTASMPRHALFVYGTLLFPEIMRRVIGRALPSRPATLHGWARRGLRGERYPGVLPALGESVEGKLCLGVDGTTLRRLDVYEGEQFERRFVHVETARGRSGAFVYALAAAHRRAATEEWGVEAFERAEFARYLDEDGLDASSPALVRGITRTRNG